MTFLLIIIDHATGDKAVYPYEFSYRVAADMEGERQTAGKDGFSYRVDTVDVDAGQENS